MQDKEDNDQSQSNGLGVLGRTFEDGWLFRDYQEQVTIGGIPGITPWEAAEWGVDKLLPEVLPDVSTFCRAGGNFNAHYSEWWGLCRAEAGPGSTVGLSITMGTRYNDGTRDNLDRGASRENHGAIQ